MDMDIDMDMERDDDLQYSEEEEGKMAHGPWAMVCSVCGSDQSASGLRDMAACSEMVCRVHTSTIIYI